MSRTAIGGLLLLAYVYACAFTFGCGIDVSLGGSPEGGAPDVATVDPALDCQPCLEQTDCTPAETCGEFSGDSFCATLCPDGTGCDPAETCSAITTVGGAGIKACIPVGGICAPAESPDGGDGPLDRCGALSGPTLKATCQSCGKSSTDCQANGCYGGWWCNTTTRRCQKPPKSCP